MTDISHLSSEEQKHFIQCDCGEFLDMRDLSQVFSHQHSNLPVPEWSYSQCIGESAAYTRYGKKIDLN
jgi:hypothetical protein